MDLNKPPSEQVKQLIDWLREESSDDTPPSQTRWAYLQQGMTDRAKFLETFVLRSVADPAPGASQTKVPEFIRRSGLLQERQQETTLESEQSEVEGN